MKLLGLLLVNGLAVGLTAYLLPGVSILTWQALLVATVVLGILNTVVKPILKVISFPVTILTLGLFSIVINGLMVWLASAMVAGFVVESFLWAVAFSVVLSIISTFLGWTTRK
ncbi:phage holin family protein [Candidatus Woesebacteria bacterium]|nr:phage holin family protein [Candidatus Woesebacteria bacterium]